MRLPMIVWAERNDIINFVSSLLRQADNMMRLKKLGAALREESILPTELTLPIGASQHFTPHGLITDVCASHSRSIFRIIVSCIGFNNVIDCRTNGGNKPLGRLHSPKSAFVIFWFDAD
jgi:hypothetical protein